MNFEEQSLKKSCSAQSVAIVYNYLYPNLPKINDRILLLRYPTWNYYIHNGGIGIERLAMLTAEVLQTRADVILNPAFKELADDIRTKKAVIIYFDKHYSPILDFRKGSILIGTPKSWGFNHQPMWVKMTELLLYIEGIISVN